LAGRDGSANGHAKFLSGKKCRTLLYEIAQKQNDRRMTMTDQEIYEKFVEYVEMPGYIPLKDIEVARQMVTSYLIIYGVI